MKSLRRRGIAERLQVRARESESRGVVSSGRGSGRRFAGFRVRQIRKQYDWNLRLPAPVSSSDSCG